VNGTEIKFGEKTIAAAVCRYLSFMRDQLKLSGPVTIQAGFTGVQGFEFIHPMKPHVIWTPPTAYCNTKEIIWTDEISDLSGDAFAILFPFFNAVWDVCGLNRANWFPEEYQRG
jgi:hypothetical protein